MTPTESAALVDIAMPKLSDSMEEAAILEWLKHPGDPVLRGEALVEVETDKATIVYEAETAGVLVEVIVSAGESARLGAVIARMSVDVGAPTHVQRGTPEPRGSAATPVARRLAQQLQVSLADLSGSGYGGRIVAADVRAATPQLPPAVRGRERRLTATQQTIARRMTDSRAAIPEFTIEMEISTERVAALRRDFKLARVEHVPSVNDVLVRATALALRAFPALNATYRHNIVVVNDTIDVGVAVATDDALVVPVVRRADEKSLQEIARETSRLLGAARARTAAPADFDGGTFTISNLGMFGVRRFNAIINSPQTAILAVGEAIERPAVVDGRVVVRTAMDVALSCDHRVVYGAEAARFLGRLRELMEHPTLLMTDQERE
jgi:pyruvate dehydrogenase E2 component (dihydrolipoamide acetyltransferase)